MEHVAPGDKASPELMLVVRSYLESCNVTPAGTVVSAHLANAAIDWWNGLPDEAADIYREQDRWRPQS